MRYLQNDGGVAKSIEMNIEMNERGAIGAKNLPV